MTARDFARQVAAELADPYAERRHASIVEQELAAARAKLAELAHVHRRYPIGGVDFCADFAGHNFNVPYPCPVRACIDGTGAS